VVDSLCITTCVCVGGGSPLVNQTQFMQKVNREFLLKYVRRVYFADNSHTKFKRHLITVTYRQNLKWRPMPDKKPGKHFTSNITSARNQWYSKDSVFLPKWRCTLWRNVLFRVFVGHRTSFQAVCRYVNVLKGSSSHELQLSFIVILWLRSTFGENFRSTFNEINTFNWMIVWWLWLTQLPYLNFVLFNSLKSNIIVKTRALK